MSDRCPACKMKRPHGYRFMCGSFIDVAGKLHQSEACKEICRLRSIVNEYEKLGNNITNATNEEKLREAIWELSGYNEKFPNI